MRESLEDRVAKLEGLCYEKGLLDYVKNKFNKATNKKKTYLKADAIDFVATMLEYVMGKVESLIAANSMLSVEWERRGNNVKGAPLLLYDK